MRKNKKTKKSRKGATSLATLILVVMTLVLAGVSLVSFLRSNTKNQEIVNVRFIENLYVKENNILSDYKEMEGYRREGNKVQVKESSYDGKIEAIYEFEIPEELLKKVEEKEEKIIKGREEAQEKFDEVPNYEKGNFVYNKDSWFLTIYFEYWDWNTLGTAYEEGWRVSLDGIAWTNLKSQPLDKTFAFLDKQATAVSRKLTEKQKEYIAKLKDADFENGLGVITEMIIENKVPLTYEFGGKSEKYKHDDALLRNIKAFIEDIKKSVS